MKICVTGGAGFIGSALIKKILEQSEHSILNIDNLTTSAEMNPFISKHSNYKFQKIDITHREELERAVFDFYPDIIFHLAAESHVDNSIDSPFKTLQTNIFGTFNLLEISRKIHMHKKFIFMHISTDEVFGDILDSKYKFEETTSYNPSSPYSATKAASDHLVRSWNRTFNLPYIITNCSNNYGPYQYPEKLIPITIIRALQKKSLNIYGDGNQIRDWLYVDDHASALYELATSENINDTFLIGSNNERSNLEIVNTICDLLNEKLESNFDYKSLITFVKDRPGHDLRYAINPSKIIEKTSWRPSQTFKSGLSSTVDWYLNNQEWWSDIVNGSTIIERKGLDDD